ncbi:hypothetical protein MRX96_034507 [Rhipicephalus microplus]
MTEAMVNGEMITEEEASAPGWIDAIRRREKSSTTTTGKPAGACIGARRTGAVTRVAAASRLAPLPTDHQRVIVRPGGGLDVHPRRLGHATADAQATIPDSTDEAPAYHHQEPDCNAYLGRSSHR